jgi:hypothetical protein
VPIINDVEEGGDMGFTEAEAKEKEGKWVHVRDDSLWVERVHKGAPGKVVHVQQPQREGEGREEGWSVCIEVYLSPDHSLSVLLHDIGKDQYGGAFEEIPAERTPQSLRSPKCSHPPQPGPHPARREALILISSRGLRKR